MDVRQYLSPSFLQRHCMHLLNCGVPEALTRIFFELDGQGRLEIELMGGFYVGVEEGITARFYAA
jgi:hypothetical protein